ncbi:MAG: glycosyltransferase family 2 protein [Alphaproteobacteria bacterium]|nr:glycosyltransferase family 2 protein [Alphaproteobacteria bacterium]
MGLAREKSEEKIPVSVVVTTKDEAANIGRCVAALSDFEQVVVVDSHSGDGTADLAQEAGAEVVLYEWDGQYPKKRQWCLDKLSLRHAWVFFVDADEVVTPALVAELRELFRRRRQAAYAGLFVRGQYVWNGKALRFGMVNNKLALIDRRKMFFPPVDDLDIAAMGEIEGHYQPIVRKAFLGERLGQVEAPLLHYAYEDGERWVGRHARYAHWEAEMTRRGVWPKDPVEWRENAKVFLRTSPLRPYAMFAYSFVWKGGALDGAPGLAFAKSRFDYARDVLRDLANK